MHRPKPRAKFETGASACVDSRNRFQYALAVTILLAVLPYELYLICHLYYNKISIIPLILNNNTRSTTHIRLVLFYFPVVYET